jgi:hypothetical protein
MNLVATVEIAVEMSTAQAPPNKIARTIAGDEEKGLR